MYSIWAIHSSASFFHDKLFQHRHIISLQEREGRAYDACLQRGVVRPAERVAEREWHEEGARRTNLLRDLAQKRDRNRRDAGVFEHVLNQSDRLIAHGSDRREQDHIDLVCE